jgi:peptide/nickel transport system substrate-binding protein
MQHQPSDLHPAVLDMHSDLRRGTISRREFLRIATLLGTSAATAYVLAGCGLLSDEHTISNTVRSSRTAIRRGGEIRIGSLVPQAVDHPARLSWVESANQLRQVAEYLTETRADGTTRPWLLEHWDVDEDMKTWTLFLRRGILFNNGDELTADDVLFNFQQWLDPAIQSSMRTLLALSPTNIERVDDYTIRLHLHSPQLGLPESLFHYPAMILHRGFEGNFIDQPVGTGPFLLETYQPGERAVFVRRVDYWRSGADGLPLPYLDRLIYLDLEPVDRVAAMQGGLIDTIVEPSPADWAALSVVPNINILSTRSAQTLVLRMRVDREPWADVRVRNALKLCQDREKILQASFLGQGDLALDAHVAPVHPAYCVQSIPAYDPEGARRLLAEAGYPDGLTVTLTTKNDRSEPELARALRELAAPGGFRINVNIVSPPRYWEQWTEVELGLTSWIHRPLATMTLALGYGSDRQGNPAPWNETHWVNTEFNTLLREAERTLDVDARRTLMCQMQTIMQEQGPVGISYWRHVWNISRAGFHGIQAHPNGYDMFYAVWKDAD